jgi:hypothetical protein
MLLIFSSSSSLQQAHWPSQTARQRFLLLPVNLLALGTSLQITTGKLQAQFSHAAAAVGH